MSKVYVIQNQHCWSASEHAYVPKFNFKDAERFGEITYLLPHSTSPFKEKNVEQLLDYALRDYTEQDYLLLVGNPVLIGLTTHIAFDYSDTVNFLQWNRINKCYITYTCRQED